MNWVDRGNETVTTGFALRESNTEKHEKGKKFVWNIYKLNSVEL